MKTGTWRAIATAALAGCAIVLLGAPAQAAVHEVEAAGNVVTGGLAFNPAMTKADVGDTVRWTNTDFLAPHTATEVHGLFDLTGDYGRTPLNPPGFGPGESRERVFEAGTFDYYCVVHPVRMRGTVTVAPSLDRVRIRNRRGIRLTWARERPKKGQVFDVQRRRNGSWSTVLDGTRRTLARFPGRRGAFRVRLRSASDPQAASGYSPVVRLR